MSMEMERKEFIELATRNLEQSTDFVCSVGNDEGQMTLWSGDKEKARELARQGYRDMLGVPDHSLLPVVDNITTAQIEAGKNRPVIMTAEVLKMLVEGRG